MKHSIPSEGIIPGYFIHTNTTTGVRAVNVSVDEDEDKEVFVGQTPGPEGRLGLAMTSGNIAPVPAAAAVPGLVPVCGTRPPRHHRPVGAGPRSLQAAAARTGHCPLVLVTTDNVRSCGGGGDTSELELLDTGSDANMWQTGNMKNLQLLFSVYLLSEVVSMIDKRVINNKNSENNEGINDFMYFLVVSLKTMTTYFPVGIIYRIIKRQ